jgi:hypothetical protein
VLFVISVSLLLKNQVFAPPRDANALPGKSLALRAVARKAKGLRLGLGVTMDAQGALEGEIKVNLTEVAALAREGFLKLNWQIRH